MEILFFIESVSRPAVVVVQEILLSSSITWRVFSPPWSLSLLKFPHFHIKKGKVFLAGPWSNIRNPLSVDYVGYLENFQLGQLSRKTFPTLASSSITRQHLVNQKKGYWHVAPFLFPPSKSNQTKTERKGQFKEKKSLIIMHTSPKAQFLAQHFA